MSPSTTSSEFFQVTGVLLLVAAAIWLALWAALAARARSRARRAGLKDRGEGGG